MKTAAVLRAAVQSVGYHWVRSLLTVLTLSAAVVGLSTIVAASSTVENTVIHRALVTGGPASTYRIGGLDGSLGLDEAPALAEWLRRYLPDAAIATTSELDASGVEIDGAASPATIVFVDDDYRRIHGVALLTGEWAGRGVSESPIAVTVNANAAATLDVGVGDRIDLRLAGITVDYPGRVVGVVDDVASDPRVYASREASRGMLVGNAAASRSAVEVSGTDLGDAAVDAIVGELSAAGLLGSATEVQRTDTLGRLATEVRATRTSFTVVGILALITGALGLANINIATLRERSAEMSLRRALGARRRHVLGILVAEGQLIAFAAAAVGIVIAVLLYPAMAGNLGGAYGVAAPAFPWWVACFAVVIASMTSLLTAVIPALVAALAPIVRVLRA